MGLIGRIRSQQRFSNGAYRILASAWVKPSHTFQNLHINLVVFI
jgi:hypothetical protein